MWGLFCPPKIPPHSLETPLWNPLDCLGQCYMYLVIIAWYHLLIYLSTVDWMFTMCQSYFEVKGVKPWTEQRCAGYVKSLFCLPVIAFSTPTIPFAIPVKIWVRTTPNINYPASPPPPPIPLTWFENSSVFPCFEKIQHFSVLIQSHFSLADRRLNSCPETNLFPLLLQMRNLTIPKAAISASFGQTS